MSRLLCPIELRAHMVPGAGIGYPAKQLSIRHSSGFRHRDTGMDSLPFAANRRRARAPACVISATPASGERRLSPAPAGRVKPLS